MPCTGSTSMLGMLRAARRKCGSISAPSTISALSRPSLSNCRASVLVLASLATSLSTTINPPSLALADSACLSASALTFFGRSIAWLRTTGPKALPPPRNCGALAAPWRARPVPFCAYILRVVRLTSPRCLVLCVPRWRLANCQRTQRCRMSPRGTRPKMASGNSTEPAASPSSVVIVTSISGALLLGGGGLRGGIRGRRGRGCSRRRLRLRLRRAEAELAGTRRLLGQRLLHRIAHGDPAALVAGHRALDEDEAALDVGLHHLEIERGDALDPEMTCHFLVLERLSRILAAARRPQRTVRDRHAVRGAQAGEIPPLHDPRIALADRNAGDVDILAGNEMIGGDLGADRDQRVLAHAELGQLAFGFDLGLGEIAARRLAHVAGAARTRAELERDIAVRLLGPVGDHLALCKAQHGHRHVFAGFGEQAGHADLLCDHAGTHGPSHLTV